jgi:glycosyltransferase involved in cell wall biosynthesis
MKIAIVAPSPSPFVVGGAEKLWWGLTTHINERTAHQADLIKLPSPEADLKSLIASYERFSHLDLGAFDVIITGKYPAWLAAHPRHVAYVLHRLRGLYDAYRGAADLPPQLAADPRVASLLKFMVRNAAQRSALPEFFDRAREILSGALGPTGVLDFPGPFARALIHWLDGVALSPGAIETYAAISHTVAGRRDYFPPGVTAVVAWPPPHSERAPGQRFSHFFTASRLDVPKRIDLIIAAMRHVRGDVPLLIAGTGPDEARLRALAEGDPRVRFLGFVSDHEIAQYYADALAVPFVPYDEDYGLITVEAMQAGKPVVTTRDAGGPCELIEDGVSGRVCADSAAEIGAALQGYVDQPALARAHGAVGRTRAANISWERVVAAIVPTGPAPRRAAGTAATAQHLVVASTFGIYPPRHGGQSRIFNLYRNLYPEYRTTIVALGDVGTSPMVREVAPGVREIVVPKTPAHQDEEHRLEREVGMPVTDVAMPRLLHLTPDFRATMEREAAGAHAVIASHPYCYPALTGLACPLWYEAHNIEWKLKKGILGEAGIAQELLNGVFRIEGDCARAAEVIICSAATDAADLVEIYGVERARIIDAPNGTDCSRIVYADSSARHATRAAMGLPEDAMALFIGSGHWPNIEAVRRIFRFAADLPGVVFVIVGSVSYAFATDARPDNVLFLGEVDDISRNLVLECCHIALNPMEHGSGTNLKMLDFFAAGIPVISTPTGARGTGATDGLHGRIVPIDEFVPAIRSLLAVPDVERDTMTRAARDLAEREFDWAAIAGRVKAELASRAAG